MIFVGTIGNNGPQIDTNLIWDITGGDREAGAPTIASIGDGTPAARHVSRLGHQARG